MTMDLSSYLNASAEALRATTTSLPAATMDAAVSALVTALRSNRAVLVCGNGGSASDAMHITGELVGRFLKERKALKAICLSSNPAVLTAWSNDYSYDTVFSRQVEAYGEAGGVILGLSTSGNSPNVIKAFELAKTLGMTTIAMTGEGGGKLAPVTDILLDAPSRSTPIIQQIHICLYHFLCEQVEAQIAAEFGLTPGAY
jgi:D-sedoheptulose 7-phosphate isomerase